MFAAHLVIPLDYYEPSLTWRSTTLLAFCLLGFNISWLVAHNMTSRRSLAQSECILTTLAIPKEVVLLFIGGVILYCLTAAVILPSKLNAFAASGGVSLGDLRQAHWEEFDAGVKSPATLVAALLRPVAVLAAISLPFILKKSGFLALVSLAAIVGLFAEHLATGGRFIVMMVVFLLAYTTVGVRIAYQPSSSFFTLHKSFRLQTKALMVAAIVVVFVVTAVFPYLRNPDVSTNVDRYIKFLYAASVSHEQIGTTGRIAIYGLGYMGDPVAKLTFFLEHTDVDEWYAMGMYSFPSLARFITPVLGESSSWLDYRRALATELTQAGLPSNPWSTGVRDLVVDFGTAGAIIAVCTMGLLCGIWGCHAERKRNWFTICISALFALWLFLMPFINISLVGQVFNSLLTIWGLYLVFCLGGYRKAT